MNRQGNASPILRGSAVVALVLGVLLLLGSWDGLYDALDLPKPIPALSAQLGGAAFLALAFLLWSAASRPELTPTAAAAGLIAQGGSAVIIAAWLIFRDPSEDLGIDTLGTTLLIVTAAVLAALAVALAKSAFGVRRRPE